MENIFFSFLETSVIISVIILGVALLSAIIDKKFTPKWKYWIWLIIALRLIIPFTPNLNLNPGKLLIEVPNTVISAPILFEEKQTENLSTEEITANQETPKNEHQAPAQILQENTNYISYSNKIIYNQEIEHREEQPSSTDTAPEEVINISVFDVIVVIWLLGAMAVLCTNIFAYRSFKRKMQTARISSESKERKVLEYVKKHLGINKNIEMLFCKNIASPMVMGFIKPKVILPNGNYGEEELYFILCHELTHYKRRDILYKSVLLLANVLHWFNPAVWLMRKLAGSDLEISCDSSVVAEGDMNLRRRYSETILAVVHKENVACSAFMTHFYGGKKTLKKRFANIFNAGVRKRGTAAFIAVILTASFLATTVSCVAEPDLEENSGSSQSEAQPEQNSEEQPEKETEEQITEEEEIPELPPPSKETLLKVEKLFAAANGESDEDISKIPSVGNQTKGLEQFESFLSSVAENKPASFMSFVYGSPLFYVAELSYTPENGIQLYTFDDYFDEYHGYAVTKVYETDLFYQFTNEKNLFFSVPKYSEITVTETEDYEFENASVTPFDAQTAAATMYGLVTHMETDMDLNRPKNYWRGSFCGTLIPEGYFPKKYSGNFYGETVGGAVINGENYYKIAIYQYDEGKNTLPYDGTVYYVNAENIHKMFTVNQAHGNLFPVARIYDSAIEHNPVTAPYALGQYGEITDIKAGDKLGFWTLESLERGYSDWPAQDEIHAVFTGNVELTGYLEPYGTAGNLYSFTVNTESGKNFPLYIDEYFKQGVSYDNRYLIIENASEIENFPEFEDAGNLFEVIECKITVSEFKDAYGYTAGLPKITITSIEPIVRLYERESFGLGPQSVGGEVKTIYKHDTVGEWTVDSLQINGDGHGNTYYVAADFSGNVKLKGKVSKDGASGLYKFVIDESDLAKMPYHWDKNMRGPRDEIYFSYMDGENPVLKNLKSNESKACEITVSKYYFKDGTSQTNRSTAEISNINIDGKDYPQDNNFATFRLGKTGENKNLRLGDKIGSWTVSDLSVTYNDYDLTPLNLYLTFTGEVELSGYIERSVMTGELDEFVIDEYYLNSMPLFVDADGAQESLRVALKMTEEMKAKLPNLDYDERRYYRIKITEYDFNYAPMMTRNVVTVSYMEEETERNRSLNSYFGLGRNGEVKYIPLGGNIGEWKLLSFEENNKFREAVFGGEVVLKGVVKPHTYASYEGYMFTISEEDLLRMPYHKNTEWDHENISFTMWGVPPLENLGEEGAECSIKVTKYNYLDAAMSANTTFVVSEITINGETYKN